MALDLADTGRPVVKCSAEDHGYRTGPEHPRHAAKSGIATVIVGTLCQRYAVVAVQGRRESAWYHGDDVPAQEHSVARYDDREATVILQDLGQPIRT